MVEHKREIKTKEVYLVQPTGTLKPFRKEDYMKVGFQDYARLVFVMTDPTLVMLPPREDEFGIEITVTLHNNRFWSEKNSDYEIKGLTRNDMTMIKFDYILKQLIEMAIEIFGYDFTKLPYEELSDETYKIYHNAITNWNNENQMLDDKRIASKSDMKKIFLAIEFLHYVDLWKFRPTYLMANKEIVRDWKNYKKNVYTDSVSEEEKELMKKKSNVLNTQISRIPKDFFVGWGKGNTGGQLTVLAKQYISDYLISNYAHDNFSAVEREDWIIDTARAGK